LNYLVHLYLAGKNPELQIGSIMGDFVKGPIPGHYPDKIRLGLQLHRQIDSLAQTSRYCRNSRQRLHSRFGHVRSIMVDIFYDHFLANQWPAYHADSLEVYAKDFYLTLQEHAQWLPEGLARIVPRMTERNWLVAYREKPTVERALQHLASRLSRPTPLGEGVTELYLHEAELREDFEGFMDEAKNFAGTVLRGNCPGVSRNCPRL
jgi:acyl carrier protein phosphodiesterase